jgi:hypothetical protein
MATCGRWRTTPSQTLPDFSSGVRDGALPAKLSVAKRTSPIAAEGCRLPSSGFPGCPLAPSRDRVARPTSAARGRYGRAAEHPVLPCRQPRFRRAELLLGRSVQGNDDRPDRRLRRRGHAAEQPLSGVAVHAENSPRSTPPSTTTFPRSATSSGAKSTERDGPPHWPPGGPSWPKRRLGLGDLRPPETSCRWTDSTATHALIGLSE